MHSSMFPKLAKVQQDVPLCSQILHLVPATLLSLCGWCILAELPEAIYWHYLDPSQNGVFFPPFAVLAVGLLSLLLIDTCGLQPCLSYHANTVAGLPPLFFVLTALHNAYVRSTCLAAAVVMQAWSVLATLGSSTNYRRRQVDGWGVLIAIAVVPMLTWYFDATNPFLRNQKAKLALGCAGIASALLGGTAEHAADEAEDCVGSCCRTRCDCTGWPAAIAAGLMGGSTLALFQVYFSSLQEPAILAYADPPSWVALWTVVALGSGTFALAAVWCMTPWWLDTCQAALVVGVLPLIGCALQSTEGQATSLAKNVRGVGLTAHLGLLLLTAVFPFMLAVFSKELSLVAQSKATGRALFVVSFFASVSCFAYLVAVCNVPVPGGELLQGRLWLHTVGLGVAWCFGVLSAPNGASRPSVHDLWYLSRHSGPPKRGYSSGALVLLGSLFCSFLSIAVPVHVATREGIQGPADPALLIVGGYNVQQGFDLHGWSNVDCVASLLKGANVDLAGLTESNPPHVMAASANPTLAYAAKLRMAYYRGLPGALPSTGGAILSRLPFDKTSVYLEAPAGCGTCQTHLWQRVQVTWSGASLDFHTIHTDVRSDPTEQIKLVAQQIRTNFRHGPLILVGSFSRPTSASRRPARTLLAELLNGTGLTEAFGASKRNEEPHATELAPTRQSDYILYRDVNLIGKWTHSRSQCSNHMLMVASFTAVRPT